MQNEDIINGTLVITKSLGNDTLIENWKVAARLSHTLAGIEEELKKVHQVASQLIDDDQPTVSEVPALAAPTRSVGKKVTNKAASVKVKMEKKSVKLANKIRRPKVAGTSRESAARGSNPAKLFAYFERTLSPTEFSAVSQTVVAKETDIPLGSMTAAIKKLIETGRVTAAPNGSLKLVQSESPVQP